MMLGDMLAAARHSSGRFQTWLEARDPELAARVAERAVGEGLTPAAYIRAAVADFASLASDEDWATLTSGMRESDDPGAVCLLAMIDWRLAAPNCGCLPTVKPALHEGPFHE